MARRNKRKQTKFLTVSAMLSALGTVLLCLGGYLGDLDLTAAALASFFCVYAVIEIGGAYPWMIWIVTTFLTLLLSHNKYPALFYVFIGAYPIIKALLERLPRGISLLLKLFYFHLSLALGWCALRIFAPAEALLSLDWLLVATYALAVAAFLIYDLALTRIITFYLRRLRGRLGIK